MDTQGADNSAAGHTWVPSSSDGRFTVLEVSLCTDSVDEAIELEAALKLLQRRTYPDIMALSAAFATYLEMYEQAKVDQIAACTEFSSLHTAIQVRHTLSPIVFSRKAGKR